MFSILVLGFLFGMRHTMEADHLAAVATLSSNARTAKLAVRQGALWGVGHTLTLFIFCAVVLFFNTVIPENTASLLELAVGIMLLVLGADMLRKTYSKRIHFHTHEHASSGKHFHAHSHAKNEEHSDVHEHEHSDSSVYKPLLIGMMHGMAGTAALMALVFQSVEGTATALMYTLIFGVGSITGMALLSLVIAVPFKFSASKMTRLHNAMHYSLGCITVGIGLMVVAENAPL